jgi:hypothetical protein
LHRQPGGSGIDQHLLLAMGAGKLDLLIHRLAVNGFLSAWAKGSKTILRNVA